MSYQTCDDPEYHVTCPCCDKNAFPSRSNAEVKELLNLTGKKRQLITCEGCGERFLVRNGQDEDFAVKSL